MPRYAILLGSAPEDFRQKKIEDMFDFLDSKRNAGDSIVTFANGISEMMMEMVLDNSVRQLTNAVVEPVETITQNTRHSEKNNRHSERSEESTNSRHSEAKPKSLFFQEILHVAQHDGDKAVVTSLRSVRKRTSASTTTNNEMNLILLYICTLQPVENGEKTIWLGGEEIRRDVIGHYQRLAMECGIDMQVVMDFGSEIVSEDKLGYEKVVL